MSRADDPILQKLEGAASATGEIHSINTDSIEIRGIFTPGQALVLRPGVKVFVLAAADAIEILDGFTSDAADAAAESVADAVIKAAEKAKRGGE
ncbi:hypothetical protein A5721_22330 [Mycobacterium vulneris]|nr:hypothetical protein A5721_22330 [Mycolicibacterium vulneris]